jgi:cytoskeletal protein CcmA (bactofilin family)
MLFSRKSESGTGPVPNPSRALERSPPQYAVERPPQKGGNGSRSQSFIDASLTIMGDLSSEGDVQLDGRICGNVRCAQLIVGRDAAITGSVTAEQAIVRGSITGTIRAYLVILQETARVESEITYTMLAIDDGASFEGAAHRSADPLKEEAASPLAELQEMLTVEACAPAPRPGANGATPGAAPGASAGAEESPSRQPPG